ncbi:MAG: hypothetical protein IPN95_21875 [Bacteroidetes bacterium]|nr:hypothetical protein [Bacteroidota bacterium]
MPSSGGIPNDPNAIHNLSNNTVSAMVTKAMENGLIPMDKLLPQTIELHTSMSTHHALVNPMAGAVSSLGEMLDLRLDNQQKNLFLETYQATKADQSKLWTTLAEKGMDEGTITRLQADAKLGFLTKQNVPLIQHLQQTLDIQRPEDLARAGLYKADAWQPLVADRVPQGLSVEEYTAGLASQINLSYPTLVTADMVRRKEIDVDGNVRQGQVAAFLEAGYPNFEIGLQPVKNWDGFAELDQHTQIGVKKVERLYQMSPSNASMKALFDANLDSAFKVMHYSEEEFLSAHSDSFPSLEEAQMVYNKSAQIYSTALNMTAQYFSQNVNPSVYAIHGSNNGLQQGKMALDAIVAPPTMENLFGNIDYCACSHCKSVLSPAAYLVDLLQFLDLTGKTFTRTNPIDELLDRRPDIEHILLTCENTNTAMPYIDLVNEVLEYYIANGSLTDFEGFNTAEGSTTPDLLADPEHVVGAAYTPTLNNVYPMSLPFDRPWENLRLIAESLNTSLAEALRIFQTPQASHREMLCLNQVEYNILTGNAGRTVPEYYGLPTNADIVALNAAVGNAKDYCRNTDLRYAELVAILKTRFINPGVDLVALLQQLGISMQQIKDYYTGALTGPALLLLLPPDLDQAQYVPSVTQWLTTNQHKILNLITLTDQHPESAACDFGNMELRFADPSLAGNRLDMLAYDRLHRFIRLWRKLGWSLEMTDAVINAFIPTAPDALSLGNIDGAFSTLLARIANFLRLIELQKIPKKKLPAWLSLWDSTIPALQRTETLAKLLKAGLTDLQEFVILTGFDPFATDMQDAEPSLIHLVRAWQLLKASGPKVVDVDYILRNADLTGQLNLSTTTLHGQAKLLRDALTAVEASLSVAPNNPDLAYARSKMALVYDNAVVTDFFGLVGDNAIYTTPFALPMDSLPTELTDVDPHLGYDAFKGLLTHTGQLSAATRVALNGAAALIVDPLWQPANTAALAAALQLLEDAGTADFNALNAAYPELGTLYNLLLPAPDDAGKTGIILNNILPQLKDNLKDNALRIALVAILKSDEPSVAALTSNKDVIHAGTDANRPVLIDFRAMENAVAINANGNYDFHVEAPATDDYLLYLRALDGTIVNLTVDGAAPVIANHTLNAPQPTDKAEVQSVGLLSWTAGSFYRLRISVANLPVNAVVTLSWRTKGMAKTAVPANKIYRTVELDAAETSLLRLQKAAMLQAMLKFTAREMGYFAGENADTTGILNALPTGNVLAGSPPPNLWTKLALLLRFVLLKKENEPDPDTWVQLVQHPTLTTPQGQGILVNVNGWTQADLDQVLLHFGLTQGQLSSLNNLYKVREAMALVLKTGYAAADLRTWFVAQPDAALITTIKGVMRAYLDDTAWLETMQSISDALRNRSRDAMVAYILHHAAPSPEIQNADQLYEYFLIDVQMDACMQTSRIRMALSSVQLFVMRCMMNLEPNVSPDSIRAKQWEWMKRYRVWEANRKIFLYPENWLEPELRDNKSPFFRELEGELLKSDITDELAEDAYLHYLKKLDDVSYLEVVGTYLQEDEMGDQNLDVLHVVGRTNGNTRQYYYRRYDATGWTAWEKISLQIEGDIVMPIMWKRKLYLFWLTVFVKPADAAGGKPYGLADAEWKDSAKVNAEITLCYGDYYKGKWSSPKSSELRRPVKFEGLPYFDASKLQLFAKTFTPTQPGVKLSQKLLFDMWYAPNGPDSYVAKITFTSKNAPPQIEQGTWDLDLGSKVDFFTDRMFRDPYGGNYIKHFAYDANSMNWPEKAFKVNIAQPSNAAKSTVEYTLTTKLGSLFPGYAVRPLMHPTANQWNAPFFYRDEHSQFFVEPTEKLHLVKDEPGYYFPEIPDYYVEIPPIMEIPWYEKPDFGGPVINPGWGDVMQNPNINVILPNEGFFSFGNVLFDGNGQVNIGQQVGLNGDFGNFNAGGQ